jgi:hypothetical protein
MGLCDSRESSEEYKGVLGHSSLTMSLVDALGRARKRWDCARQRSPNTVKGEMRQGLTLGKAVKRVWLA